MKNAVSTLLVFGAGIVAACSVSNGAGAKGDEAKSSGSGTERSFAAANFDQVELRGPDNVTVVTGGAFSVIATGPSEILDKLEVKVDGGTLKVGRKDDGWFGSQGDDGVTVTVTLPAIKGASLAGSGDLNIDKADAPDFAGNLAGSGDMSIGVLTAQKVNFSIAGSGNIGAAGKAKELTYSIAGSGDIETKDLEAETAHFSIAGSGGIEARVTQVADVNIMGSGDVALTGGAKCNSKTMGSGEVLCAP